MFPEVFIAFQTVFELLIPLLQYASWYVAFLGTGLRVDELPSEAAGEVEEAVEHRLREGHLFIGLLLLPIAELVLDALHITHLDSNIE